MKVLLQKLIKLNIHLSVKNGELSVKVPKSGIEPSVICEIRNFKEELIIYLSDLSDTETNTIQQVPLQHSYPLSLAQKRMWELSNLENGSKAYNIPGTIKMAGEIDWMNFMEAVNFVVDRHEALRTVFKKNESGEIRQYILSREDLNFKVEYLDYSNRANKNTLIADYINQDAFIPFDLENGPLFRSVLFKMERELYIYYYNMHSIAADGESIEIFTKEAMSAYAAILEGETNELPNLSIQFKDFAHWQSKQLETGKLDVFKKYWMNQLGEITPNIDLPFQKERPQVKTFNGKLLGTNLSAEMTEQLKNFVSENGGNLFMAIMASWKVLLYQYTELKEMTIGTPALGRDHPDLEGQVGPYINTIAIRSELNPSESFLSFYNQVKETILKSYSYQMYPFEQIVEDLKITADKSRSPIFEIVVLLQREEQILDEFQFSNNNTDTIVEGGIGKKYVDTLVAKYDLEIDFRELEGCFWFNINYNTDLYERDNILDIMHRYKTLLHSLIENYNLPIYNAIPNKLRA